MASVEIPSTIPADELADVQEFCRLIAEGKRVTEPALLKRIHERSEHVRRAMLEKHGTTDIAVELIREVRDEE
jgi:hypothetical protein